MRSKYLLTSVITLSTLIAFAANSILCRKALISDAIGPVEFTTIRLLSAMLIFLPIILFRRRQSVSNARREISPDGLLTARMLRIFPALALFSYAIFFSLAYVQLTAGTGALLLFGSVQVTMLGIYLLRGNRVGLFAWLGLATSFAGLVYLLLPGLSAPSAGGTALMILSGVSWGVYSILGKQETDAIMATARNFLYCLPGAVILVAIAMVRANTVGSLQITMPGVILALCSGAVASGFGYVLWYLAVKRISTSTASIVQLLVPLLAAIGGVVFLGETLSMRLVVAGNLIGGGVALSLVRIRAPQQAPQSQSAGRIS